VWRQRWQVPGDGGGRAGAAVCSPSAWSCCCCVRPAVRLGLASGGVGWRRWREKTWLRASVGAPPRRRGARPEQRRRARCDCVRCGVGALTCMLGLRWLHASASHTGGGVAAACRCARRQSLFARGPEEHLRDVHVPVCLLGCGSLSMWRVSRCLLRWRLCDGRVFLAVLGCGVRAVFLARPCWVGAGVLAVGAPCTVCGGWPGWARYGAAVQLYALCSASAVCLLPCAVAGCPLFCAGHMLSWGAHRAPCGCRMRR
jgi:hypothetical protein